MLKNSFKKFLLLFVSSVSFSYTTPHEFLCLADLIVDHIGHLPSQELNKIVSFPSGTEQVNEETLKQLLNTLSIQYIHATGGAAANTLKTLAKLGHSCAIMGKMGKDAWGEFYQNEMKNLGVDVFCTYTTSPTAQVVSLSDQSGLRNMFTSLSASLEMKVEDVLKEAYEGIFYFFTEGYAFYRKPVFLRTLEIAKSQGAKTCIDLSSYNLVREFKKDMLHVIKTYIDIVFADKNEARELTGIEDPCLAALEIAKYCEVAIVHQGAAGGFVAKGRDVVKYDAFPVAKVVDTTGAGDLFAAGFLHAYANNEPLSICALYGAALGAAAVQVEGTDVPKQTLSGIVNAIATLKEQFHYEQMTIALND